MKFLLLAAALCGGTGAAVALSDLAAQGQTPAAASGLGAPAGSYLDVRTATVFGGACHVGSEAYSQGRHGLAAWLIESGGFDGQDLAGVRMAAVISGPGNLGLSGGLEDRSSLLVIDAPSAAAAATAESWLRSTSAQALGEIVDVRREVVELTNTGEGAFDLRVGNLLAASGEGLADRACCSMPEQVWYGPLAGDTVLDPIVGFTGHSTFAGAAGLDAWTYDGSNTAFLGTFGPASILPSCCGVEGPRN